MGIGENSVDLNCGLRIGDGGVQTEDRSHVTPERIGYESGS
jgi:hypothetical protein